MVRDNLAVETLAPNTSSAPNTLDTEAIAMHIAACVIERKGLDLTVIDVRSRSSYADFIVICTGRSDRHAAAIAQHIEEELHPLKVRPLGVEGKQFGQWILMDFGDVIVHIFNGPQRRVYDIEALWADAETLDLDVPDELNADPSLYEGYELDR